MSEPEQQTTFTCPGEKYPISRAVHLGRLAAFYPACRQCPHRDDSGALSPRQVEQLREVEQLGRPQPLFHAEGAGGAYLNDLTPTTARNIAAAFGIWVKRASDGRGARGAGSGPANLPPRNPTVILAGDGRAITAELSAAVGEGIRSSGCDLIDIGPATSACLAFAVHTQQAAGGILVGNPGQEPHIVGLQFWDAAAQPLSAGGSLEPLAELFYANINSPSQSYGSLRRMQAEATYLATMSKYYHALRPLVVIVDSASRPLLEYLQKLFAGVACRLVPCRGVRNDLPSQIRTEAAHIAVSIDGDGETCRVWDEQGRTISAEKLSLLLALHSLQEATDGSIVLEDSTDPQIIDRLRQLGACVVIGDGHRAAMATAMRQDKAILGGGPSGRFWHAALGLPLPDALMTITRLLTLLSRSDEPLSAVLDRDAIVG